MKAAAPALLLVLLAGCDSGGEDQSRSTDTTLSPATPVTTDPNAAGTQSLPAEDAYGTASGTGTGPAGSTDRTPAAGGTAAGTRAEGGSTSGEAAGDSGAGTIDGDVGTGADPDPAEADRLQDPEIQGDSPADTAPTLAPVQD